MNARGSTEIKKTSSRNFWYSVLLVILAFFLQAVAAHLTKLVRLELPTVEIAFFRFLFGLLIIYLFALLRGQHPCIFPKCHLTLHIGRSLLGIFSTVTAMYSIHYLSLGDQTALGYLNPLVLTLLGRFLLKESVPAMRWFAVFFGLAGVTIVATPSMATLSFALIPFLSGRVAAAASDVMVRVLRQKDHTSSEIVGFFFLLGAVCLGVFLPAYWVTPSFEGWCGLFYIAGSGVLFQLLYSEALGTLGTTMVAPFSYTTLAWAFLFDILIWGDLPTLWGIVGSLLVVADAFFALLSLYTEQRKRQKRYETV